MITVGFNKVYEETNIALGNHMFQYSICRIVASKNNFNFHIPYVGNLKKCFPEIDLGICDGTIKHHYNDSQSQIFDQSIFNVKDFTNLLGFFQTEKYFIGYEDDIKSWFKIEMDNETKNILEKYPIDEYCYIHIRGGDNKINGQDWLVPKEFYTQSMSLVNQDKNLSFVIITDDIEFSKSYFPEIDIISNSVIIDFKILYYAKYSIISASTFSWWARWLGDDENITISPNKWLNCNKKDTNDFYPIDIKTDKFIWI
jgi:hypothetical protein